jgi:hypothetical protein
MRKPAVDKMPETPFEMLMGHFDRVLKAVDKMAEMIDLYLKGDFGSAGEASVIVSRLEHEADEIKTHMRRTLPRLIFTPISRQDMLDLLTENERIADTAQDVAQVLDLRRTKVPKSLHAGIRQYSGHVVESVKALERMMEHFGTLLEGSFSKGEAKEIMELGLHVHEHEYKADAVNKELARAVYSLEGKESAVTIFHLLKFLDVLDGVADHAENASLRLVVVVSK